MARRRKTQLRAKVTPVKQGKPRGFGPFRQPTNPPAGTYDPALDAQERASGRGLADLMQDTEQGGGRATSDYLLARGDTIRGRDEGLADIMRRRTQEGEDYGTNLQNLDRRYVETGRQQGEGARRAGVRGGALAQALAKRTSNKALDKAPIDTGYQRFQQGSAIDETRLNESTDRRLGALSLDFQRGGEDRTTALTRAQRENTFFGQDVGVQRWFQAKQSGADLPAKPANEFTKRGVTYQTNTRVPVAKRQYVLPTGQQLGRKQFRRYLRRPRGPQMVGYGQ